MVSTITAGVNDDEVGGRFTFGINTSYVRGINFQPAAFLGRILGIDMTNRITLSGILKQMEAQSAGMLKMDDFIPLPCDSERVAIIYMYKTSKGGFIPITRNTKIQDYLHLINNTFVFTIIMFFSSSLGDLPVDE